MSPGELAQFVTVAEAEGSAGLLVELGGQLQAVRKWSREQCDSFVGALTHRGLVFVFHFFAEHGGPHYAVLRDAIDHVATRGELAHAVEEHKERWERAAQPDDRWHVRSSTPPPVASTTTPARLADALRHWMADPRPLPESPSRLSLLHSALLDAHGFNEQQAAELRASLDEIERALLLVCLDGLGADSRLTLRALGDAIASGMSRDQIGEHYRAFIGPWRCGPWGADGRPLALAPQTEQAPR